jgi:hypothetical protein
MVGVGARPLLECSSLSVRPKSTGVYSPPQYLFRNEEDTLVGSTEYVKFEWTQAIPFRARVTVRDAQENPVVTAWLSKAMFRLMDKHHTFVLTNDEGTVLVRATAPREWKLRRALGLDLRDGDSERLGLVGNDALCDRDGNELTTCTRSVVNSLWLGGYQYDVRIPAGTSALWRRVTLGLPILLSCAYGFRPSSGGGA